MAFPISHLLVAHAVAQLFALHEEVLPAFYLGALAPDAVHFREGMTGEDKRLSHMRSTGDEPWGYFTQNEAWEDDVLRVWHAHKDERDAAFWRGACTHVLTDVYNNRFVWSQFRSRFQDEHDGPIDRSNPFHKECAAVDRYLSSEAIYREYIRPCLMKAVPRGLVSFASQEEVRRIQHNIVYVQYENLPTEDLSAHRYMTLEDARLFVEEAPAYVHALLERPY